MCSSDLYGLNQLFPTQKTNAEGGVIKSYAKGGLAEAYAPGGSVMSPEFKRYAVDHIDPRQLPVAQRNAMARGDSETAGFAKDEMALDAAIRRGIAAAAPYDMDQGYADGGIVAFANGGGTWQDYIRQAQEAAAGTAPPSPEEYAADIQKRAAGMESLYGPNEVAPIYERQQTRIADSLKNAERMGLGTTLLRMAAALQKSGVNPGDRYGGMFAAAAEGGEKVQGLRAAADEQLLKAEIAGAQARQAYRKGNVDQAIAAKQKQDEYALKHDELQVRAADTGAQVAGGIERERMQNATQRAVAARPGEIERFVSEYESRLGRKLTPEEYKKAIGEFSESRVGARYDRSVERALAVETAISNDPTYKENAKMAALLAGSTDKKAIAKRDAAIAAMKEVRKRYEDNPRFGGGATGDGGAGGGGGSPVTVTANGQTFSFPNQEAANQFKAAAGIK